MLSFSSPFRLQLLLIALHKFIQLLEDGRYIDVDPAVGSVEDFRLEVASVGVEGISLWQIFAMYGLDTESDVELDESIFKGTHVSLIGLKRMKSFSQSDKECRVNLAPNSGNICLIKTYFTFLMRESRMLPPISSVA